MADEQNELEVLEARREILQLEIALARERRAALEAEQKAKKTADNGGEPTLDYVVPSKYPDARHAESLPTAGILRRGKPTLLPLPTNPVLQHLAAPWSSPLANLASRFVTLVSPLRGET